MLCGLRASAPLASESSGTRGRCPVRLRIVVALLVVIASLALLVPSAQAQGKGGCVPFQATVQGSLCLPPDPANPVPICPLPYDPVALPYGAWLVEGNFLIGGQAHQGTIVGDLFYSVVKRAAKNSYLGFEQGFVTLDDGTTFTLAG